MLNVHTIDSFIILNPSTITTYWSNIIYSAMGKSWTPNIDKIIIVSYANTPNKYHSMYGIKFKTNIACLIPLYGICSITSDLDTLNKYIIQSIKLDNLSPDIANLINYKVFVYSHKPLQKSHMKTTQTKLQTSLNTPLYEYCINYFFTQNYTLKNDNISGILKYYNEYKTKNVQTQTDTQLTSLPKTFIEPTKQNDNTKISTNSKYNIQPFNFSTNKSFGNYMKPDTIW